MFRSLCLSPVLDISIESISRSNPTGARARAPGARQAPRCQKHGGEKGGVVDTKVRYFWGLIG